MAKWLEKWSRPAEYAESPQMRVAKTRSTRYAENSLGDPVTTVHVRRPPRQPGPELPRGELLLESPPVLPEPVSGNFAQLLVYLPMVAGAGAMVFMFTGAGGGPVTYLASSMYALSSVGMMFGMLGRTAGDKRRRIDGERRDYLRYLGQVRRRARTAAARQRAALCWHQPEPDALWSVAMSSRLWERRPANDDFGVVRVGSGPQRLAVTLVPPDTQPVEDLDPISASALRDLVRAHATVPDLPVAVALCTYARISVTGDDQAIRGLAQTIIGQLATFHAPAEMRVVACASRARLAEWSWLKWLPHALHPTAWDGAGRIRMVRDDLAELEELLGDDLADRPRFGARPEHGAEHPHILLVYDGGRVTPDAQLAMGDAFGVTVLDLTGTLGRDSDRHLLRLRVATGRLEMVRKDPTGTDEVSLLGRPDQLRAEQAEALARVLAPLRTGTDTAAQEPLEADNDLPALLGLGDVATLDPTEAWRQRVARDRLRVAVGLGADGGPVDLDLKESAQGGMGPHGLIVGATGSGKSELLRTLVLGLAMTHSSETLNFALVDFKGGATFLGLDELPHTSAIITNLADELPLVDRMQDALRGELVRRQELLRAAGNYTSVHDYERARQQGAALRPLPTLIVIVDEFSELLASKPEFTDLFVMIGRLGRSLAVHLLLASQRLEEGRLRGLDTHLSYRICLRTFSAMESRVVLGVPDAYELPTEPGNGYLKFDVTGMTRFKAAYVSGAYRKPQAAAEHRVAQHQIVPYTTDYVPPQRPGADGTPGDGRDGPARGGATGGRSADGAAHTDQATGPRVFDVIIGRLRGTGPPAHRMWLPPLGDPVTLDALLPDLAEDPASGLLSRGWPRLGQLCAPIGIIDRPFEQRRDLLVADLSGAAGHVGVVGATQTGKSTLIRSLIAALALTNTPAQAQFYCLDFGGGALAPLAGLPHVGGVCGRLQPDVVRRTVAEVSVILEEREKLFSAHGIESMAAFRDAVRAGTVPAARPADVFLVVDGWGTLRQEFDSLEPAITKLAARGLAYGVHVMVAANRWAEIRPQLKELLATRCELRLGEPFESEVNRHAAANVPESSPGRGLTKDGFHFMTALPRIDGRANASDTGEALRALAKAAASAWAGPAAPAVRLLPLTLNHQDLLNVTQPGLTGIPFGIAEDDLGPVTADFTREPHFLVFGDTASGKSNLLRVLADAVVRRHSPDEARIIILDYRRSLLEAVGGGHLIGYAPSAAVAAKTVQDAAEAMRQRLPGPDVTAAQLRDRSWWHGPELYLIVDDYDLVATAAGNPMTPLLEVLPHSRDIGLHVVLARASGGAGRAMFEPVLQRLRDLGSPGILLSGSRDEGHLLGNVTAQRMPPGRGSLVSRSLPTRLVQTALLPPAQ
jgi:S-DNA-T family DNA segregation ATPase FtsK/SpoIIIE